MKLLGERPLRRFELLVALCAMVIVLTFFMQRMAQMAAASERVNAEQSMVNINSMLTQLVVRHAVTGTLNKLAAYADSNPMELLVAQGGREPGNYQGELSAREARLAARGGWFFDRQARELVYRFRSDDSQLRLRLRFAYADANANGVFDAGNDRVIGLYLETSDSG